MSPLLLLAIFVLLPAGLSVRPRSLQALQSRAGNVKSFLEAKQKMQLLANVNPDQNCLNWLATADGTAFTNCQSLLSSVPSETPVNNCTVTTASYDTFCNSSCYAILVNGYEHIISSGDCLPVFEALYSPCRNNTDCAADGTQYCYQGNCYAACRITGDCNTCTSENCVGLPNVASNVANATTNGTACVSNITIQGTGTMNFRGLAYTLRSYCVKNFYGQYCGYLTNQIFSNLMSNLTGNITAVNATVGNITAGNGTAGVNVTAFCNLYASFDCCLGTALTTYEYCQYRTFSNALLYQCNNSNYSCAPLPPAQSFCTAANATVNGTTSGNGSIAIGNGIGNGTGPSNISSSSSSSSSGSQSSFSGSSSSSNFSGSSSFSGSSAINVTSGLVSSIVSNIIGSAGSAMYNTSSAVNGLVSSVLSGLSGVAAGNPGNHTGAAGTLSASLSLVIGLMLTVLFSS